ncbi:MAG: hypothetical protein PHS37_07410, partial [Candidatus Omnitrophica bacterium]|nr:hypothetical protein [Candidatus Omnitrophota bacterium]
MEAHRKVGRHGYAGHFLVRLVLVMNLVCQGTSYGTLPALAEVHTIKDMTADLSGLIDPGSCFLGSAADGKGNVYLAFHHYMDVIVASSFDHGNNWRTTMVGTIIEPGIVPELAICADDSGAVYIVWKDESGLYFNHSGDSGRSWHGTSRIGESAIQYPALTSATDGTVYLAYAALEGVYCRKYDRLQKVWSGAVNVDTFDTQSAGGGDLSGDLHIACDARGNVYIARPDGAETPGLSKPGYRPAVRISCSCDYGETWAAAATVLMPQKGPYGKMTLRCGEDGYVSIAAHSYKITADGESSRIIAAESFCYGRGWSDAGDIDITAGEYPYGFNDPEIVAGDDGHIYAAYQAQCPSPQACLTNYSSNGAVSGDNGIIDGTCVVSILRALMTDGKGYVYVVYDALDEERSCSVTHVRTVSILCETGVAAESVSVEAVMSCAPAAESVSGPVMPMPTIEPAPEPIPAPNMSMEALMPLSVADTNLGESPAMPNEPLVEAPIMDPIYEPQPPVEPNQADMHILDVNPPATDPTLLVPAPESDPMPDTTYDPSLAVPVPEPDPKEWNILPIDPPVPEPNDPPYVNPGTEPNPNDPPAPDPNDPPYVDPGINPNPNDPPAPDPNDPPYVDPGINPNPTDPVVPPTDPVVPPTDPVVPPTDPVVPPADPVVPPTDPAVPPAAP